MGNGERLDSWKDIAAYLQRSVRTAQRWEREAGLPVHRVGIPRGSVYAFRGMLDEWWRTQQRAAATSAALVETSRSIDAHPGVTTPDTAGNHVSRMRLRGMLEDPTAIDPESAASQVNLAAYLFMLAVTGQMHGDEALPAARAAIRRALALDPYLPRALTLRGVLAGVYERDWTAAGRAFEQAWQGPVSAPLRFDYAVWFLSPLGRHEEALTELDQVVAEAPSAPLGRFQLALELQTLGRRDEAVRALQQVTTCAPDFGPAFGHLSHEYARAGDLDRALEYAERAYTLLPSHPNAVGLLAGLLRRLGMQSRADALLDALAQEGRYVSRALAEAQLVCGSIETAIGWMSAAAAENDPGVWLLLQGWSRRLVMASRDWPLLRERLALPSGSR